MRKIFVFILSAIIFCLTAQSQILYRIDGNGMSKPSYVIGTHHLAPLAVLDSVPAWKDAYANAAQVVGEIDMTGNPMELSMKMQPYMMAPSDSTLSKVIAPDVFSRISEEFKKWVPMPGMELQMLDMMRPMAVSSMVSVEMVKKDMPGFNPGEQLDTWFQAKAKEDGKPVVGRETPEYQAEVLFCSTPVAKQAEALVDLLDKPEEKMESVKKLNSYYMSQNIDALYNMSKEEEENDAEFMEALLTKRNANWMKVLPGMIRETPSLIVVGALHLPGENGILESLRKEGFTVTPIK